MSTARRVVKVPIHFYRKFISPLKPATCRFYPTCSAYALEAVEVHGALKGSCLRPGESLGVTPLILVALILCRPVRTKCMSLQSSK
ncbi:protein YidD [Paenibacillus sp. JCM 10914]|nr:protein YidD [Paenibacillus sp. JCM 10914]